MGTRAQQVCSHAGCSAVPATLNHIFMTCPLAAAVVAWVPTTWGSLTGEAGPPHSADLFLADDRRAMGARQAPPGLVAAAAAGLAMLTCLLAAHRAAQAQPAAQQPAQQSASGVSARILGHMRAALQHEWLLVGGGLRRAGGCAQRGTGGGTHG